MALPGNQQVQEFLISENVLYRNESCLAFVHQSMADYLNVECWLQDILHRKKVEELEAQAETDGGCRERAGRYMKSGRLSREIVEAMIDHIYVGKRIPGTKNVPVEIHWDF